MVLSCDNCGKPIITDEDLYSRLYYYGMEVDQGDNVVLCKKCSRYAILSLELLRKIKEENK